MLFFHAYRRRFTQKDATSLCLLGPALPYTQQQRGQQDAAQIQDQIACILVQARMGVEEQLNNFFGKCPEHEAKDIELRVLTQGGHEEEHNQTDRAEKYDVSGDIGLWRGEDEIKDLPKGYPCSA